MKKQLLLFMFMLLPMLASADAVEIDGIYYNLVSKAQQAEVTWNNYTGNVVIPGKVTYEGVEYSVTSIGAHAFYDCSSLSSITIPSSVTSIGTQAFSGCSGLNTITIPNSVTSIESSAFTYCSGLTSITIPNSVTSISYGTFKSCTSLTSINIPYSVTSIEGEAFSNCSSLASITIPNSVTNIEIHAFIGCSGLTSITIPNSVTSISYGTFTNCTSLISVTIGSNIQYIGDYAFSGCTELKEFYCHAESVPTTVSNVFQGSYIEYAKLRVPDESVSAYSNAEPWKNFGSIVGINGGEAQKCATPTISYGGKKLSFACTTDGVEFVSEIKDADVKTHYDAAIDLTATYEISVYATKTGFTDSDKATATLVWTAGSFTETTPPSSVRALADDTAVLIQSQGGVVTVQGAKDGTPVNVYSIGGTQAGSAMSHDGLAQVSTNLPAGSAAIVKIGQKAVKVVMK